MIAARLAAFYGAIFLMMGIHLPFWPIWLAHRGLGPEQIGTVMASAFVVKVLITPGVAHLADRHGERKRVIATMVILSLICFLAFDLAHSFWAILLVSCLFVSFWSPTMPLMESLTMQSSATYRFDYGRVRLWGSITFIVGSVGIGYVLGTGTSDLIFSSIALTLTLSAICAFLLPDIRPPKKTQSRVPLIAVVKDRSFVLFLVGAALIQASHAVYYAFGTIHWQKAGHGSDVIGWLWAEGVVVEIVLFIFGAHVLAKIGPARLIALAGLAGAIRWTGTALSTELPVLILLQTLHGATFGAAHLGAMHFIQNRVPSEHSATAQSLYAGVVMGVGMGIAMFISGRLYGAFSGQAYFLMAAMAATGGIVIFLLRRQRA